MEEPGYLLRAVIWHFGSGDSLFAALVLLLLAVGWQARGGSPSRVVMLAVLSLVWMSLGAWPSVVMYRLLFLVAAVWIWATLTGRTRLQVQWRQAMVLAALFSGLKEVPHSVAKKPYFTDATSVAIIGDSVTAGLNAGDHTWPRQLAEVTGRTVFDASQQGATVKSALTQLEKLDGRGDVLWIEIGGNDILESLPSDVYRERLDQLLQAATKRYPKIVLMEIPAPPGGGRYGYDQRRLAAKYHIPLVPKRQFLSVLTSSGGTQDGVHLANAVHAHMASVVQTNLGWQANAAGKDSATYVRCE